MFSIIRRYRSMILASILFFYLGCGITISFLKIDCVEAEETQSAQNNLWKDVEYAVLIMSGPNNELKRDAIRTTWCKFVDNIFIENGEKLYKWNHTWTKLLAPKVFIKYFFVIGTENLDNDKMLKLSSENNKNNDLLLLTDFEDSYKNLARKLISSLKWFDDNMQSLKYLIKCDDDSFVRIDLIVRDLDAFAPEMNAPPINEFVSQKQSPVNKGLYWGYFDGRARVYLNGKWQEKDWFLCDNYLPYALGGGYVISKNIVKYIANNADILSHYNSEDVSMGVWTAALNGINRVHDTRFDTEWKSRGCSDFTLVRHKQTPSDMFEMYKTLVNSNGEKLCKIENMDRKSYIYKWDVLPSKCCR